jgi:hypothetical protein
VAKTILFVVNRLHVCIRLALAMHYANPLGGCMKYREAKRNFTGRDNRDASLVCLTCEIPLVQTLE